MDGKERIRTILLLLISLAFVAMAVVIYRGGQRTTALVTGGFFGLCAATFVWMLLRPAPPILRPKEGFDADRFPYPLVTVPAGHAMAALEGLTAQAREAGEGYPVIIGNDASGALIVYSMATEPRTPEAILGDAAGVTFPDDLFAEAREDDPEEALPDGDWPGEPPNAARPEDVAALLGRDPVHIAILPAASAAEVPAWLKFGGFNGCPETEHHIAALRLWGREYGAEVVALTSDTMILSVTHGPATRQEALALARIIYAYSDWDLNDLSELAADLMVSRLWIFWWD